MSRLSDLLKRRQALIAKGNKAFSEGTKAFEQAAKVDEEILELVERANELFGGGDSRPRPRPQNSEQYVTQQEAVEAARSILQKKGRVPSLQEPIREVLEKNNNQPMSQDEILAALEGNGVAVKGKRPKHTLSAHVSYLIKKEFLVRVDQDRIALKQALLIQPRQQRTH